GAALDTTNKDGNTALHIAAEKEKVDLFELLLEASSLDNKKIANTVKKTPFDLALEGQNQDIKNIVVNFFKDKTVNPEGFFHNKNKLEELNKLLETQPQPQPTSCLPSFSRFSPRGINSENKR
ncbi:MAG: ankyrin repeat domain-containing protein, partial [Rickettsiales bacterium]